MSVLRAKRLIETILARERTVADVPSVAEPSAFENALVESGINAKVRRRQALDVQVLRRRLGLAQEQFAARFGLDVTAVRNWETQRLRPDTAARSLLTVIARFPDIVAESLDG